jgi:hypothetical protein
VECEWYWVLNSEVVWYQCGQSPLEDQIRLIASLFKPTARKRGDIFLINRRALSCHNPWYMLRSPALTIYHRLHYAGRARTKLGRTPSVVSSGCCREL